jgi:hypothetical protein
MTYLLDRKQYVAVAVRGATMPEIVVFALP